MKLSFASKKKTSEMRPGDYSKRLQNMQELKMHSIAWAIATIAWAISVCLASITWAIVAYLMERERQRARVELARVELEGKKQIHSS